MVKIAFYKASGNWINRAIRWGSKSEYSHVEIVGFGGTGLSSSHRDGGVRVKQIEFDSDSWDIIEIPWIDLGLVVSRFMPHLGKKYDYWAIVFSHVLAVERHSKTRWICSELVAHCLALPNPHTFSPGRLHELLKYMKEKVHAG